MRIEKLDLNFLGIKQNVLIYRDDLFPYYYGGNKARKILFEKKQIQIAKAGAVVTTGGIQSNHCRVTALLCAEMGLECHLVLHGSEKDFHNQSGNASIIRSAGSFVYFVEGNEIGPSMDSLMNKLSRLGKSPYYLYGGGHTESGFFAYVSATENLLESPIFKELELSKIYLASGTGSTQAGIIQGVYNRKKNINVCGISIARTQNRGVEAIKESLSFCDNSMFSTKNMIEFNDQYLLGGYGKRNEELNKFIHKLTSRTGILFDSTYTGKAFFGMVHELLESNEKSNIMFWHTGGQFNSLI